MQGLTRQLATFAAETSFEQLPPEVVRESKRLILDTIGCAIGGVPTDSGAIALRHVQAMGGQPTATVVGGGRSSPVNAAYANARLANVLDADDTFPTGSHFGSTTVFGALALCEQMGRSGRDFITAVAVGFDVGARIGCSLGPPINVQDGKVVGYAPLYGTSATMTWAAVGAAASAARMGAERTTHAFGIAGANTPLPAHAKWSASVSLPMHKYSDAGWCAQTGVNAVLLAELGSTGYADILDGDLAFFRFFGAQKVDNAALSEGLAQRWHLLNTTYKPWPSCRWTHHPLTAFLRLQREHGFRAEDIERIVVKANPFALSARFKQQQPDNQISAEFSHAHVLAMAAHGVPAGPLWYSESALHDPKYRHFRERVTVELEPRAANLAEWMVDGQFRRIPGGVEVHVGGRVFAGTADMAGGDPWSEETLFTDAALREKFVGMVGGGRHEAARRVIEAVERLEDAEDLARLCQAMMAAS
ncbi:MAG TPA: MmgE/PrpD family protein [Ramlibacter sp.]|nr:MmgE/PrpD family protein [Ramlibacter sp.]